MRFLVLLPLLLGCYRYAPLEHADLQPGTGVRARVNAATAEQIEPLLGTTDARVLSGVVVSVTPDTVLVEVPTTTRAAVGSSIQTLHQRIALPRASLLEIESRRIDRVRTGLIAGAVGAIGVAVLVSNITGEPGDEGPPGSGELPEIRALIRASLLRLHF